MIKAFSIFLVAALAALAGCTNIPQTQNAPQAPDAASPCAAGESSYACQVDRYQKVSQ